MKLQTMADFVREIRARYDAHSDYALAKLLNLVPSALSAHKSGRAKHFSEETAFRIAELLDLDPGYVLSCLSAERAKEERVRKTWERVARSLAASVAVLMLGAIAAPSPAEARSMELPPPVYYVKSLAGWLARLLARLCSSPRVSPA